MCLLRDCFSCCFQRWTAPCSCDVSNINSHTLLPRPTLLPGRGQLQSGGLLCCSWDVPGAQVPLSSLEGHGVALSLLGGKLSLVSPLLDTSYTLLLSFVPIIVPSQEFSMVSDIWRVYYLIFVYGYMFVHLKYMFCYL